MVAGHSTGPAAGPMKREMTGDSPLPLRVLVIEDAPPTRRLIEMTLGLAGCAVESCADGAAGLARILADPPDVVVLDIALPTMGGWEILARLRSDPTTRSLPVVVATAHAAIENADRAAGLGADAFIGKPFDPAVLRRAVLEAGARRRAA